MSSGRSVVLILLAAEVMLAGCGNAGEDRVLAVPGTGLVGGVVFLDRDGDRSPGSADVALPGVRVRLLVAGTRDTVATASSGADGVFAFGRVAVGQYTVLVPGEPNFGDSITVVRLDTADVDLAPEDTVEIQVAVSFPSVSIAEARALPLGTKVFIEGVALNFRDVFADTILHVRDTSRAIRITNTQGPLVTAGDSARVLGTIGARAGQPVVERGQVTILGIVAQPTAVLVTTAEAAGGRSGELDADLVQVVNATIAADTTTQNGDYVAGVNDGSGVLRVVFDSVAFTRPSIAAYRPGVVIDARGLLVPDGAGGWRIKPRTVADLVVK